MHNGFLNSFPISGLARALLIGGVYSRFVLMCSVASLAYSLVEQSVARSCAGRVFAAWLTAGYGSSAIVGLGKLAPSIARWIGVFPLNDSWLFGSRPMGLSGVPVPKLASR